MHSETTRFTILLEDLCSVKAIPRVVATAIRKLTCHRVYLRLSGCDRKCPASHLAQPIAHLFFIVGMVMMAILLLVTILVLYASFRFRARPETQGARRRSSYV